MEQYSAQTQPGRGDFVEASMIMFGYIKAADTVAIAIANTLKHLRTAAHCCCGCPRPALYFVMLNSFATSEYSFISDRYK